MDDRFAKIREDADKREALKTSERLNIRGAMTADAAARAVEIAPSVGVDPNALARHPEEMDGLAAAQQNQQALRNAPGTRDFVNREPVNAALAADEIGELGWFDRKYKELDDSMRAGLRGLFGWERDDAYQGTFGRGLEQGSKFIVGVDKALAGVSVGSKLRSANTALSLMDQIDQGAPLNPEVLTDPDFMRHNFFFDEQDGRMVSYMDATPEQRQAVRQRILKDVLDDEAEVKVIALELAAIAASMPAGEELSVDNLGEVFKFYGGSAIVTAAPALVAAMMGGPTAAAVVSGSLGVGDIYMSGVEDQGAEAFTDADLARNSMLAAPVYAATEFLGPFGRLIRGPFRNVPDELVLRALRGRGIPQKVIAAGISGAVEEGIAEMVQEMLVDAANGKLDLTEDGIKRYLEAAAIGAIVGGPLTATIETPGAIAAARQNEQAQRDGLDAQSLQEVQDRAGNVKLRERSPAKWREFLQSIGTENGKFYVEPEPLRAAVSSGEVSIEQLGITESQISAAIENGGRVEISQLEWAANLAGTKGGQTLLDNGAVRPDGFTPQQLRNFSDIQADLNQQAQVSVETREQITALSKELRVAVRDNLRAAGQSPEVAKAGAEVWTSMISTIAERSGDTGVFERFGLTVEGLAQRKAIEQTPRRTLDQGPPKIKGSMSEGLPNRHTLMPHLRVPAPPVPPDRQKALFTQKTTNANAPAQLAAIDEVLSRHPDPASSPAAWTAMLGDALADTDVPVPPYGFIRDINSGGAIELLQRLTPGQIKDADHGFENARQFREAYTNGEISIADTGKLFLWSFLSRGVSPYTQESLFIDAWEGVDQFIEAAANGTLDLTAYKAWARTAAPAGSGQPGAGATHNLNAFGELFLSRMSQDAGEGDGRTRLQVIHDMMADPTTTGRQIRRKFMEVGEGVGIDNKVVSFTLLVAGFDDVLVLDRVQMRQMWNDGRFDGLNIYDGYKVDKKPVGGSALAPLTFGARGLLLYEAMETALDKRIAGIYDAIGRPEAASIGRYHWETWVASSQQEASHATIDAILAAARGEYQPLGGVTAKEGEYGSYAYGARYGVSAVDGSSYFLYEVPERGLFQFTVPNFQEFLTRIKRPGEGVIPNSKFKVTEAGNGPWYFQEGVSLDRLAAIAGEAGTAVHAVPLHPVDVVNGLDQTVSDGPATDQFGPAVTAAEQDAEVDYDPALDLAALDRLNETGADIDTLRSHPAVREAEARMLALPETDKRSGYGTDGWLAQRRYTLPDGNVVGFRELMSAMDGLSAAWSGGGVRQERRASILIGPPAAGKSTIAEDMIAPEMGARIVDADEFKKALPEYRRGIGANAVHEESSDLSDWYLTKVLRSGDNVILPKVGGNPASIEKLVTRLKSEGYTVDLAYMEVTADETFRRMIGRFVGTGRLIPPDYLLSQVPKIKSTYDQLKEKGIADGYTHYDNNTPKGSPPDVVEDTRDAGRRYDQSGADQEGARGDGPLDGEGRVAAFERWFGDSKVVDENGDPLIVYHGTAVDADFETFDAGLTGSRDARDTGFFGRGIYFSERPETAATYSFQRPVEGRNAARTIPAYLKIERPFRMDKTNTANPLDIADGVSSALRTEFLGGRKWSELTEAERADVNAREEAALVEIFGMPLKEWEATVFDPDELDVFGNDGISAQPEAYEAILKFREDFRTWVEKNGYDGIMAGKRWDFGANRAVYEELVVFSPEQVKSPFNAGTFDPADPRILRQPGARGQIVMPENIGDGDFLVRLFQSADESTFFHEAGHAGIEILRSMADQPGAPQQIVEDVAKVHAWMAEITGEPVAGPYTTAQQEAWAEAFEAYLKEGVAPSPTLKTVFQKLRRWLTRIYESAIGSGASPTAEIREVMDRLLATDAQIEAAKMERGDYELFREIPPFMSAEEWHTYKRVAERGDAEAEGRLLNKAMAAVRKRRSKEWRAAYKTALEAERERLRQQPEYVLLGALGGADPDVGLGARLDRDTLVSMFGEAILTDLERSRLKTSRNIFVKDGADPEQIADMFGFRNGSQMVQSLRATRPLDEQADLNAKKEANKLAPELTDKELREEAEASLKNPARIERVAREASALVKGTGTPSSWQQMNAAAKARAEQLVGGMNVRTASNYHQFSVAAGKAARDAQRELAAVVRLADGTPAPGGVAALQRAAMAKRKQLVNEHMYRIARDHAQKFTKARTRFRKLGTAKSREQITPEIMDQIDALLEQYDFRIQTVKQVQAGQAARKTLLEFEQDMVELGRAGELAIAPSVKMRAAKTHYSELSVDELDAVVDAIDNLTHVGRSTHKAYVAADQKAYGEMVGEISLSMGIHMRGRRRPERESAQRSSGRKLLGQLNHHIETANTTLGRMDGFQPNGPAMRFIKMPLDKAAAALEERREQAATEISAIYRAHYSKREVSNLNNPKRKIHVPELGTSLTKAGILSMALNTGNEGNFQRLTDPEGTGTFDANRVNMALGRVMEERDWRFVQDVWDYINSYWPEIRTQEREVTGVTPKQVTTALQVQAPDFVTGGYYPIKYDRDLNVGRFFNGEEDAYRDAIAGRYGKAQTAHGHTEARLAATGKALDLNLGVIEDHVMQVVHDLTMRKPVNNAVKILNSPAISSGLSEFGRQDEIPVLNRWLRDTAAGDMIAAEGLGAIARYARKALTVKYIGFKISTVLLQPLGLFQAGVVIGNRTLLNGFMSYTGRVTFWHGFAQENSAHMRTRIRTMNREVNDFVNEARRASVALDSGREKFANAAVTYGMVGIQQMQYWAVDLPVFVGVYEKSRADGLDEAAALYAAELAVDKASGSGLLTNRAELERGTFGSSVTRSEMGKMFTLLASYVHAKYNAYLELKDKTGGLDVRRPAQSLAFTASMVQLFVWEAIIIHLWRNLGEEEEDQGTAGWWAKIIGAEALAVHPLTRPAAGMVEGFGVGGIPLMEGTEILGKGGRGAVDIATGEGNLEDFLSVFDVAATPLMLPTGQLKEIIRAIAAEDPGRQFTRAAVGLPVERE